MIADSNQHLFIWVLPDLLTLQTFGSIQNPHYLPLFPKLLYYPHLKDISEKIHI